MNQRTTARREEPVEKAKPFWIPKEWLGKAFRQVKANGGMPGVDGQTIQQFEEDLDNQLYKLWNRMSSGSYFPKPLLRVEIPRGDGGTRPLGVPTVTDRVAQTVVKMALEPELEKHFHPDSYAYRPEKSALQAVGEARKRCWRYDWVLDLDIKGFFDSIDHELMMRAVRKHTDARWILLYIERWLTAPVRQEDGTLKERHTGTPQGGVISPLLANLLLHYVFDKWMGGNQPYIPFERYADDIICHCKSEAQAKWLLAQIERRLALCKLKLNREKTQVVYCGDDRRRGAYPNQKFDFLGFTFRPRRARNRYGEFFVGFLPAVSGKAAKAIRRTMRKWRLHLHSDKSLEELARYINPVVRGWINYYGCYYRSELRPVLVHLDRYLVRWARRKYKRLQGHKRRARIWLRELANRQPDMFAHWTLVYPAAGR